MPGYIITNAEVFDAEAYGEYGALAPAVIKRYGGEFLAQGGATEIMEGSWAAAPHCRHQVRQRRGCKGDV